LQKLQHDKERIARDLHDNIGGQLSYIIYSLDGINHEDKEKRSEVAGSINQSVRSVINSLRETIWAINDANIDAQDFSDKLKLFARNLFKHGKTKINFTENIKTKREMNSLVGLNLYRICQEILNNAFKYANATEVKIDLQCDEEKLFIVISDNGIGFDITHQNKEHYGLQNIKKRAMEFGISLKLETGINKGTRYELLV
jgi:signal transduction histidine kinase